MKTTRLIDLTKKYLDAEDDFIRVPSPENSQRVASLRARLTTEINWLNEQRAKALARINP